MIRAETGFDSLPVRAVRTANRVSEDKLLGRLFFAFPGGLPGITLLLVRAVFGITLFLQGSFYIGALNPPPGTWVVGSSAILAGCMLVLGFLTPIVGTLVGVGSAGVLLSLLPTCTPNVFDSKSALIFALTMLVTLIVLGPGRFSVDARVFGRREIMIPPPITRSER